LNENPLRSYQSSMVLMVVSLTHTCLCTYTLEGLGVGILVTTFADWCFHGQTTHFKAHFQMPS